jgi:hypothetical protein
VLAEFRVLSRTVARVVLGAAIIDDVLALDPDRIVRP